MKALPYRLSIGAMIKQLQSLPPGVLEKKLFHLVALRREGILDNADVQSLIYHNFPEPEEVIAIIRNTNTEEGLFVIADYVRELNHLHSIPKDKLYKYHLNQRLREIYQLRPLPPKNKL